MRILLLRSIKFAPAVLLAGCTTNVYVENAQPDSLSLLPQLAKRSTPPPSPSPSPNDIVQAAHTQTVGDPSESPVPEVSVPESKLGLAELTTLTLERHPRLRQVEWAVEAARGRAIQVGLYPNPTLSVTGDELGDKTGPGGIWTAPMVSQEIVTGGKLGLSREAALKEVDQATLTVIAERFRVLTEVRQYYWEVVTLQRRAEVLGELITLAEKSVENADKLLKAKVGSELDVVQLEVDRERYKAELDATKRALPAAFRRLAASTGLYNLPEAKVGGDLELPLTDYDLQKVKNYVLGIHPEMRSAQIGVERAQLVIRRAEAEPIPNVTVSAGYVRQSQNRSDDWMLGISLPIPVWNQNQGNIFTARAQLGEAHNEAARIQNELVGRIATAFATYGEARGRAEKYKTSIIPKAERSLELSQKAYQGGQFEYLRVLQAQRAIAEARLEYLRSLGDMWRAASTIAGLMLEDQWPNLPLPPKK